MFMEDKYLFTETCPLLDMFVQTDMMRSLHFRFESLLTLSRNFVSWGRPIGSVKTKVILIRTLRGVVPERRVGIPRRGTHDETPLLVEQKPSPWMCAPMKQSLNSVQVRFQWRILNDTHARINIYSNAPGKCITFPKGDLHVLVHRHLWLAISQLLPLSISQSP